jgi:hypothetical protein
MQASGLEGREEMPLLLDHPVDHPDDPTGPVWIDEASNLSRADWSGADQIDAEHQATDLAVGFESLAVRDHWASDPVACQ